MPFRNLESPSRPGGEPMYDGPTAGLGCHAQVWRIPRNRSFPLICLPLDRIIISMVVKSSFLSVTVTP